MATLTNVNRKVQANENFWERDIVWVRVQGDLQAAADLLAVVDVLGLRYSISYIGNPGTADTIFACHGPAAIDTTDDAAFIAAVTATAATAVSVVSLTGLTFA